LIQDAHNSLSEICSGGKIKELLAQGTSSRHTERSAEQERIEKARQIPHHMYINLELVECAHFVSAMLLEVPNMAANAHDIKRKVISRAFRKLLDYFDRQAFSGPPENTRESVVAAARYGCFVRNNKNPAC
jgi:translation initiation factor 3 subunit C